MQSSQRLNRFGFWVESSDFDIRIQSNHLKISDDYKLCMVHFHYKDNLFLFRVGDAELLYVFKAGFYLGH